MTDPQPHRIPAVAPTRAITYTTDDPNQPADPSTDPHAASPAPAEAGAEAPAGKRARKPAE